MKKEAIRDWTGWILGWIETDEKTGDKTARSFNGVILGYYKKRENITTDFYGRRLYQGDQAVGLIHAEIAKSGDGRK